jgi:hypothetical protein
MPTNTKRAKVPSKSHDAASKAAFDALLPRLEAIPKDAVRLPNADVEACAIFARGVGRRVKEPALYARFASLPAQELDIAHVDDLEPIASAVWYATVQLATATATRTDVKVPGALVQRATETKARMLKVVTYHFEDHPRLGPEIADIILGTGYRDLAGDLTRLARIYVDERATVSRDPKHYVAADADKAPELAQQILDHLGLTPTSEGSRWMDIVARGWTLLSDCYGEVAAAGLWLMRRERGEELFSSLVAAGRNRRTKLKKEELEVTPPEEVSEEDTVAEGDSEG